MLGRHVYRVHPDGGQWMVRKEGESRPRGAFAKREQAIEEACRLADSDQPSRVTIDDGDGAIVEERLFGTDLSQQLDTRSRF